MLIFDFKQIGNKLFEIRKKIGMTQAEVAEQANLSDRTYAEIERGTVNMRIETILKICDALKITPDIIMTDDNPKITLKKSQILQQLEECEYKAQETALEILSVYLNSLK